MAFHVAQVKYMAFFHILIKHTAAALGYVSPRPWWFILGTMLSLGQVVFIWFLFKKQKEMKKKKKKTKYYEKNNSWKWTKWKVNENKMEKKQNEEI